MEDLIWYIVMIPCSMLFTGIGIYAWRRKKPMWFWSGTEVKESEISDVPAYNRANGIMWVVYSVVYWIAAFSAIWSYVIALILVIAGSVIGIPVLIIAYRKIYKKYKIC